MDGTYFTGLSRGVREGTHVPSSIVQSSVTDATQDSWSCGDVIIGVLALNQ